MLVAVLQAALVAGGGVPADAQLLHEPLQPGRRQAAVVLGAVLIQQAVHIASAGLERRRLSGHQLQHHGGQQRNVQQAGQHGATAAHLLSNRNRDTLLQVNMKRDASLCGLPGTAWADSVSPPRGHV